MVNNKRKMTIENFRNQEKRIQSDNRYSLELKKWSILQLLNVFREINHCLPHQMKELDSDNASGWRW